MFLTVEDGLILGPICWLFGKIFDLMYKLIELISNSMGIGYVNLSICVILFTFFIRACLFPLNFKQQKSSKIMSLSSRRLIRQQRSITIKQIRNP